MHQSSPPSIEEILDKIGFGKIQIQLIFVGGLALIAALNDTLGTSFILPASQCDFQLTTSDKGIISSSTFLGVTISCYFWGFLGDFKGRKWVIARALICSSIFSTISALVENFAVFLVCRFLVGVL